MTIVRAFAALVLVASCRGEDHAGHAAPAASAPLTAASVARAGHEGHAEGAATPAGYAPVMLDEQQARAIGLQTVEVGERDLVRKMRTVGVVALDETRTAHVHTKVRGWIDTIQVSFVGQKVAAGQPLCSIYSQDVYAAELEFLSVLDRVRRRPAASGEFAEAEQRASEQLLAAGRRRLALWDVPKAEIDRLESSREAKRTFPLLAPRAGVVVAKQALDGMFVDPSVELYTTSDLSRIWVMSDIYEGDLPWVRVGQVASLEIEGTTAPVQASVAFLAPTVDETSRTTKARFDLRNPDGKLRPGAFVTVTMDLGESRGLAIPESAVIRTGTRSIVFVVHGGQHVQPREIRIGSLVSGWYPIASGLEAGEHVATGAQFLLDSESRLRATSEGGGGHVHSH